MQQDRICLELHQQRLPDRFQAFPGYSPLDVRESLFDASGQILLLGHLSPQHTQEFAAGLLWGWRGLFVIVATNGRRAEAAWRGGLAADEHQATPVPVAMMPSSELHGTD